nr:MAG TPA: putative cytoplasmic protein [Caudoviricetes sp.]
MFINPKSRLYNNLINDTVKDTGVLPSSKCPKCKTTTHPHFKYCSSCGHQLRGESRFCQCGNKLCDKDNYCTSCGRKT